MTGPNDAPNALLGWDGDEQAEKQRIERLANVVPTALSGLRRDYSLLCKLPGRYGGGQRLNLRQLNGSLERHCLNHS